MIIKATLVTLILILVVVIASSYYVNKEGFDDISNGHLSGLSQDLTNAVNTVSADVSTAVSSATGSGTVAPQSINDSISAPTSVPTSAVNGDSSVPIRTDVVPEVSISGTGYDAMSLQQRADLLRDIQKVVRNEILLGRSTTPMIGEKVNDNTDSTAQGKEYENSCYKDTEYRCPKNPDGTCPPMPDMSQYIKKDAIPCWGCALDY